MQKCYYKRYNRKKNQTDSKLPGLSRSLVPGNPVRTLVVTKTHSKLFLALNSITFRCGTTFNKALYFFLPFNYEYNSITAGLITSYYLFGFRICIFILRTHYENNMT